MIAKAILTVLSFQTNSDYVLLYYGRERVLSLVRFSYFHYQGVACLIFNCKREIAVIIFNSRPIRCTCSQQVQLQREVLA